MKLATLSLSALLLTACANPPSAKTVATDVQAVLEGVDRLCALTQIDTGNTDLKAVAAACGIVEKYYPDLDKLLDEVGQAKVAAAKIKASAPAK